MSIVLKLLNPVPFTSEANFRTLYLHEASCCGLLPVVEKCKMLAVKGSFHTSSFLQN